MRRPDRLRLAAGAQCRPPVVTGPNRFMRADAVLWKGAMCGRVRREVRPKPRPDTRVASAWADETPVTLTSPPPLTKPVGAPMRRDDPTARPSPAHARHPTLARPPREVRGAFSGSCGVRWRGVQSGFAQQR